MLIKHGTTYIQATKRNLSIVQLVLHCDRWKPQAGTWRHW